MCTLQTQRFQSAPWPLHPVIFHPCQIGRGEPVTTVTLRSKVKAGSICQNLHRILSVIILTVWKMWKSCVRCDLILPENAGHCWSNAPLSSNFFFSFSHCLNVAATSWQHDSLTSQQAHQVIPRMPISRFSGINAEQKALWDSAHCTHSNNADNIGFPCWGKTVNVLVRSIWDCRQGLLDFWQILARNSGTEVEGNNGTRMA